MSRIVQIPIDAAFDQKLRKLEEELKRTNEDIVATSTVNSMFVVTINKRSDQSLTEVPKYAGKKLLLEQR